jgi:hypothetical protein
MVTQLIARQRKAHRQQGVNLCRARGRHGLLDYKTESLSQTTYAAHAI